MFDQPHCFFSLKRIRAVNLKHSAFLDGCFDLISIRLVKNAVSNVGSFALKNFGINGSMTTLLITILPVLAMRAIISCNAGLAFNCIGGYQITMCVGQVSVTELYVKANGKWYATT